MIKANPEVQTMYALKYDNGKFCHPCSRPKITRLYDSKGEIFKVEVREIKEGEKGEYWGWIESGDTNPEETGEITMIWPSKIQSDMCFSYGPKKSEEAGHGRQVNLVVTEVV